MSDNYTLGDVLGYAWAKDAVNLAPAIDSVMSAKASEAIENMTADVAASMFGAVSATAEEPVVMDEPSVETNYNTDTDLNYNEGTTDVEEV